MDWCERKCAGIWRIKIRIDGEIAESVLQAGGTVTGVEPKFFMDAELQYDNLTELIVTKDMTERKTKMIELGMHLSHFRAAQERLKRFRK